MQASCAIQGKKESKKKKKCQHLGGLAGGGEGGACVHPELTPTEVRPNILTALIHSFMSWFRYKQAKRKKK